MSQHGTTRPERETTSEAVHVRNYDAERAHRVWINVVDDGEQVLETTRRLRPGEARSIEGELPPGEYEVEVGIDGLRRTVGGCQVGEGHERTVLVEMGNGLVSVSQGVR